jgi:hypothetical protein
MLNDIGGRKFAFAILLTILFGAFVAFGKMTVEQFSTVSLVAYGLFAGANVAQKFNK